MSNEEEVEAVGERADEVARAASKLAEQARSTDPSLNVDIRDLIRANGELAAAFQGLVLSLTFLSDG
jgi:hypothetical protein